MNPPVLVLRQHSRGGSVFDNRGIGVVAGDTVGDDSEGANREL